MEEGEKKTFIVLLGKYWGCRRLYQYNEDDFRIQF